MYTEQKVAELKKFAADIRIHTLEQFVARGFEHLGSSMSIVDIIAALYGNEMKYDPKDSNSKDRDWFICSKGHA